jgi:hypothetical protein
MEHGFVRKIPYYMKNAGILSQENQTLQWQDDFSAGSPPDNYTVRKEQFKFILEVLIKFCLVAINMVYNLKICTFICDDKLNCIQFEQT